MPAIKFIEVLSYSSEDPNHPVENLLKPITYLKWKSSPDHNEKQEYAVLKLERLSRIQSIDIGNDHSAFIEVLVSREGQDFHVLLVASSFMTPLESRNCTTPNRVRMFGPDKLNKNVADQKWDRIKVICTQPFNRQIQYGLTFITVNGPGNQTDSAPNETKLGRFSILEDEKSDDLSVGSLFQRRKEIESPLSGAAAIRAASKAAESPQPTKRPLHEPANAPETGFYQLKKVARDSPSPKALASPNHHLQLSKDKNMYDKPSKRPKTHPSKDENMDDKPSKRPQTPQTKTYPSKDENMEDKPSKRPQTPQTKETASAKAKQLKTETESKIRKSKPFNKLMGDVVFVMSGYQNPQRGKLRDNLITMGAKYKSDWGPGCTHLICAFKNTPKFQAVKGKGKIVSEKWIEDSFKKKKRLPWRRYSLEKNRNEDESEEEVWATEICPIPETEKEVSTPKSNSQLGDTEPMDDSEDTDDEIERAIQNDQNLKESTSSSPKKVNGIESDGEEDYDADTDVDEELLLQKKDTSELPLPSLSNFMKGKTFFFYGSIREAKKKELKRYIVAYRGTVSDYMNENVSFVLTEDPWDENFDDAVNENPSIQFVKPRWIWKCCDKEKLLPPQPFLIVPQDNDDN